MSVQVTRFSEDARLKLAGFTDENDHAPTQLYVIDEDDTSKTAVLVFPLAPVTIKLKLDETAPNGDATNSCTFTIQPSALKWQSRINYRLKDRECAPDPRHRRNGLLPPCHHHSSRMHTVRQR